MATDHHFPRYHPRPETGYVNDPNGPVFAGDRWHLFFQYVYDTPRTGPVVWGHATSTDLARWRLHRPAISPHPQLADRDGCWSGNTVVDDGTVVAFYSGCRTGHPYQSVLSASSANDGESFGPARQVVDDPDPAEGIVMFRDPFVWRDDGRWLMIVGAGHRDQIGQARLYASTDLRSWRYRGVFAELPARVTDGWRSGEAWECPQLLSVGDRDALLVATYRRQPEYSDVLALTGRRSGDRLDVGRIDRLDHGTNFYAPAVLRDSPYGPLVWGWATEARSADWSIEAGWSGMLTLPRTATLTDDGRLACAPPAVLDTLRRADLDPAGELPGNVELRLDLAGHRGTGPTTVTVRFGSAEHLDLTVDWPAERVTLDTGRASTDPRAYGGACSFAEPGIAASGALTLRWYLDGSVGELFTGSGRTATVRFYPVECPPWTVTLAGRTPHDGVEAWVLDS